MIGWAIGGIIFGILGDKIGRAKTMILTILIYSAFTGLSALSTGVWDFSLYRFLTGLGVGGQFAVGVSLVAEVMSDRARPMALGWLQALSAVGNMMAAAISMVLGDVREVRRHRQRLAGHVPGRAWSPPCWSSRSSSGSRSPSDGRPRRSEGELGGDGKPKLGSLAELFGDPRWRRNTIVGMVLAFAGVVGLWGIGFFSFDLVGLGLPQALPGAGPADPGDLGQADLLERHHVAGPERRRVLRHLRLRLREPVPRPQAGVRDLVRPGRASTAFTFWFLDAFWQIFVLIPIMGFCQLALFGGYAIYFPELFPTRLRSTGTSFCYNVRPAGRRRRLLGQGAADQPGLQGLSRADAVLPASPCASSSCSGSWPCRSPPRPRISRCRSESGSPTSAPGAGCGREPPGFS